MKKLKDELPWLMEVDSTALQSVLKDLDCAYQKFFMRGSNSINIQTYTAQMRINVRTILEECYAHMV